MNLQTRLLRRLRRWTLVLALGGAAYIGLRFEFLAMPEGRCSPVARFDAGDRLVVDRYPGEIAPGDAVLIRSEEGALLLVVVSAMGEAEEQLWCTSDCSSCVGFDSAVDGWVDRRAVAGRVLLAWVY